MCQSVSRSLHWITSGTQRRDTMGRASSRVDFRERVLVVGRAEGSLLGPGCSAAPVAGAGAAAAPLSSALPLGGRADACDSGAARGFGTGLRARAGRSGAPARSPGKAVLAALGAAVGGVFSAACPEPCSGASCRCCRVTALGTGADCFPKWRSRAAASQPSAKHLAQSRLPSKSLLGLSSFALFDRRSFRQSAHPLHHAFRQVAALVRPEARPGAKRRKIVQALSAGS